MDFIWEADTNYVIKDEVYMRAAIESKERIKIIILACNNAG